MGLMLVPKLCHLKEEATSSMFSNVKSKESKGRPSITPAGVTNVGENENDPDGSRRVSQSKYQVRPANDMTTSGDMTSTTNY
ncbi:unnamed protein product [Phytophthora lilii]|uniref:Unnamed protein product n=1 Tax=Phytophthora lilii TaxID=2077276 RepID=A0A9W6WRE2_9STRA|nr:unnamed protein product [Phytophthora lilii]